MWLRSFLCHFSEFNFDSCFTFKFFRVGRQVYVCRACDARLVDLTLLELNVYITLANCGSGTTNSFPVVRLDGRNKGGECERAW